MCTRRRGLSLAGFARDERGWRLTGVESPGPPPLEGMSHAVVWKRVAEAGRYPQHTPSREGLKRCAPPRSLALGPTGPDPPA